MMTDHSKLESETLQFLEQLAAEKDLHSSQKIRWHLFYEPSMYRYLEAVAKERGLHCTTLRHQILSEWVSQDITSRRPGKSAIFMRLLLDPAALLGPSRY
ncbi:hypothetical protein ODZ83_10655 [Acaricomes phytoseiuli]|uniref:hypothetical protein n=1 Tax=Acaricomes phytoseiuli TaxID=291968 RepID=UPI0022220A57|nr:hypothetical protein [Acaricomes phytoseiuli]MCW1250626.1 hypothetical protein [Acaricomes phytoseiuli]